MTLVTFGISCPLRLVTFGEQKTVYKLKLVGLSSFFEIKDVISEKQFLKHRTQFFVRILKFYALLPYEGDYFMSIPCCHWSAGKLVRYCRLS